MCHDGITASEARFGTIWNRGVGSAGDPRRDHPVDVRYADAMRHNTEARLRPPASLPPQIRLANGKVTCLSCHDLYNLEPHQLSVSMEGSSLCLTCHQMD
ncbi:MAG: hypothetical protein ACE5EX_04335 [Phycisphaerae bacterium]